MSREIRFRAWDKERKELLRVTMMDFPEWWVSCRPCGIKADPLKYGERNSFKNTVTDRHVLMQYTGLKDKNGKEIYEGDIVKECIIEDVEYDIYEVEWICDDIDIGWSLFPISTYEIIGNIYENPELLEKEG